MDQYHINIQFIHHCYTMKSHVIPMWRWTSLAAISKFTTAGLDHWPSEDLEADLNRQEPTWRARKSFTARQLPQSWTGCIVADYRFHETKSPPQTLRIEKWLGPVSDACIWLYMYIYNIYYTYDMHMYMYTYDCKYYIYVYNCIYDNHTHIYICIYIYIYTHLYTCIRSTGIYDHTCIIYTWNIHHTHNCFIYSRLYNEIWFACEKQAWTGAYNGQREAFSYIFAVDPMHRSLIFMGSICVLLLQLVFDSAKLQESQRAILTYNSLGLRTATT